MSKKDEALKLAKVWFERNTYGDEAVDVYEALCEALAEPAQQEPVWKTDGGIPRFKKPWIGLSEEDREQHRNDWNSNIHDKEWKGRCDCTSPQPAQQQEPIGEIRINQVGFPYVHVEWVRDAYLRGARHGSKLYLQP